MAKSIAVHIAVTQVHGMIFRKRDEVRETEASSARGSHALDMRGAVVGDWNWRKPKA